MRARPNHGGMPWWHARPFYWLLFKGFLLTVAAWAAALLLVLSVGSSFTGLREYNAGGPQFIRERTHFFLVPPESITGSNWVTGDAEWRWMIAEMKARAIVVFVLWVVGVSLLIWQHSRRRGQALPSDHPGSETSKLTAG
jgi:hypothetical protein